MEVIVKIRGGLGNQLFQYAYARKMLKSENYEGIIIDSSYFNKKHIRNIAIDGFKLPPSVKISNSKRSFFDFIYLIFRVLVLKTEGLAKLFRSIVSRYGYILSIRDESIEKHDYFQNFKLAGYFQNVNDIEEVRDSLIKELIPLSINNDSYSQKAKIIETEHETIAVSIRIGEDYKKFGWKVCTRVFYENGLKIILEKKHINKIYIFSDCIDLIVKEKWFEGYNIEFMSGYSPADGLYLMSLCKNFVITNSTFAWWGAYLSNAPKKIIIAPEYFFSDKVMAAGGLHINGNIYLNNFTGEKC